MNTIQQTGDPTWFTQQMTTNNTCNPAWIGGSQTTSVPTINIPTQQNGTSTGLTIGGMSAPSYGVGLHRRMFCDRKKHRMYRAIGETCPCFRQAGFIPWNVPLDGQEGFFVCEGIQYLIDANGLVSRVNKLFERLELQEELIDELKAEIARLKEDR